MNILNKNHITLSSPAEIEEICAPLKKINIETFIYIKNYKNGKLIHLSNRGNWLEHFYERNFYKIGPFEKLKDIYKEGVLLWSHLSGKQVMREAKEYFNMAHGITIVEKNFDGSDEFYSFGAGKDNPEVVIFCLNNIDMLKRFILYFKCKAEKILKHAEQNKIILPPNCSNPSYYKSMGVKCEDSICNSCKNPVNYAVKRFRIANFKKKNTKK